MHPANKLLIKFTLYVALFLAIFYWLPGVRTKEIYGKAFQYVGGAIFGSVGHDGFTRFCSAKDTEPGCIPQEVIREVAKGRRATADQDTLVVLGARKAKGNYGFLRTSSRLVSWWPAAFVLVLFLSTPIAWRRRLMLGAIGFFLIHLFIAFRVYVWLIAAFTISENATGPTLKGKAYSQYQLSEFWFRRLFDAKDTIHFNLAMSFVAAVVVWVAVMTFSGDTKRMFQALSGGDADDASPPPANGSAAGTAKERSRPLVRGSVT